MTYTSTDFHPQNPLEHALMRAAHSPAYRARFYRDLVEATVYVLHYGPAPLEHGSYTLEKGASLVLRAVEIDGLRAIPFFSSLERLQVMLDQEATYIALKARELFKVVRGQPLVLNPGSAYGKLFTPEEVEAVLDGSIWQGGSQITVPRETEIMVGEPAVYPTELVAELKHRFKKLRQVKRAWLALYANPADGLPPHLLVVLDVQGNWQAASTAVGEVVQRVEVPNPPVDVMALPASGPLRDYFLRQSRPFYTRTWWRR